LWAILIHWCNYQHCVGIVAFLRLSVIKKKKLYWYFASCLFPNNILPPFSNICLSYSDIFSFCSSFVLCRFCNSSEKKKNIDSDIWRHNKYRLLHGIFHIIPFISPRSLLQPKSLLWAFLTCFAASAKIKFVTSYRLSAVIISMTENVVIYRNISIKWLSMIVTLYSSVHILFELVSSKV